MERGSKGEYGLPQKINNELICDKDFYGEIKINCKEDQVFKGTRDISSKSMSSSLKTGSATS